MCKRCASCGKPCEHDYCDPVCVEAAKYAINPAQHEGRKTKFMRGHYRKSKMRDLELEPIA